MDYSALAALFAIVVVLVAVAVSMTVSLKNREIRTRQDGWVDQQARDVWVKKWLFFSHITNEMWYATTLETKLIIEQLLDSNVDKYGSYTTITIDCTATGLRVYHSVTTVQDDEPNESFED